MSEPANPQSPGFLSIRPTSKMLFWQSTTVYLIMFVVGFNLMDLVHGQVPQGFAFHFKTLTALTMPKAIIAAILIILLLFTLHLLFLKIFKGYQRTCSLLTHFIGTHPVLLLVYLAFLSAIGEELLFRAGIQPFIGIFWTSVLFGLLHIGPDGRLGAWSFWSFIAGILLGILYEQAGNIWPVIFAHFTLNMISMLVFRFRFLKIPPQARKS